MNHIKKKQTMAATCTCCQGCVSLVEAVSDDWILDLNAGVLLCRLCFAQSKRQWRLFGGVSP